MIQKQNLIQEMNERSRIVFRNLVESYLSTGEPIGSQTLAKSFQEDISPATIRNVMQDLEPVSYTHLTLPTILLV